MPALSDELLSELGRRVADQMGLNFLPDRRTDLERGVLSAARELGASDVSSWVRDLLAHPFSRDQIEVLASELTIGETYFFREQRSFEVLGERVLPEMIRARQAGQRRLRIWSAGCCTGEEPYSIAILLDRLLPRWDEWHVTILATDVNPRFLRKAAAGIYNEWSFRDAAAWLKSGYFTRVSEHRFEILPRIRERVTFAHLNVAEDSYPSLATNTNAMDLIFCRNVLMYFAPERAARAIENLHRSLVDNGWLLVGPSDVTATLTERFAVERFEGAILYRKQEGTLATPAQIPWVVTLRTPAPWEPSVSLPPVVPSPEPAPQPVSLAGPALATEGEHATYQQASALVDLGRYRDAAARLQSDPASLRDSAPSFALLARISANLGELAEARSWADKALAASKLDPGLHYLRAVILQEEGSFEEAVAALKRALYLLPDFVMAHFALGNLCRRQGRTADSERHFRNARLLLKRHRADEMLPHSDGLVAARLDEIIESSMALGGAV